MGRAVAPGMPVDRIPAVSDRPRLEPECVHPNPGPLERQDFTAKDFCTWAGTLIACTLLGEFDAFESETQAKKNIVQMVKQVAVRLGNTPSVCRKCYVHPTVLECYLNGEMIRSFKIGNDGKSSSAADVLQQTQQNESALMRLLRNGAFVKLALP